MRRHGWIGDFAVLMAGVLLTALVGCGGQASQEMSAQPPESAGSMNADSASAEKLAGEDAVEKDLSADDLTSQGEAMPRRAPLPMPAGAEPVEPELPPRFTAKSSPAAGESTAEPIEGPSIDASRTPRATRSAPPRERLMAAPSPYAAAPETAGPTGSGDRVGGQAQSPSAEPGMAWASSSEPEPSPPEVRMAPTAPAPPPAPAAGSVSETAAAPAPPEPAPAEAEPAAKDYTTITVFYGTDRLALQGDGNGGLWSSGWLVDTATCGAITLVVALIALRLARRRAAVILGAAGALATVAMATWSLPPVPHGANGQVPQRVYGNQRGPLELGNCQVTVPRRHEVGQVERPSIFRLEFQEDSTRHIVLADVVQQPVDEFYARLKDRIGKSPKREAFVFVHGFNVTFEAAARRTAQLAYDLQFDAAPIFFSWPSQGGLLQYTVDETNVVWAVPHLKEFLLDIVRKSGAQSVHLIAHSMGNRALTSALQSIAYEFRDSPPMFNQVVLTAPDIDADVFRRDIAPAVIKTADRVTLYASSNDEALVLSKQIHGYPRAGDTGGGLLVIPGIDTIDVSTVDTSLIGHSYYGSNSTVLEDLLDLLHEAKPPDQRPWLHPMQIGRMMYWVFLTEQNRLESAASRLPATR